MSGKQIILKPNTAVGRNDMKRGYFFQAYHKRFVKKSQTVWWEKCTLLYCNFFESLQVMLSSIVSFLALFLSHRRCSKVSYKRFCCLVRHLPLIPLASVVALGMFFFFFFFFYITTLWQTMERWICGLCIAKL